MGKKRKLERKKRPWFKKTGFTVIAVLFLIKYGPPIFNLFKKTEGDKNIVGNGNIMLENSRGNVTIYGEKKLSPEEQEKITPKISVGVFPFPAVEASPYIPPNKGYRFVIQNINPNSVEVRDCRLEVYFGNTLKEVKGSPIVDTGADLVVSGLKVHAKHADGTVSTIFEEKPPDTSLLKTFDLNIIRASADGREVNSNTLFFNCDRWPDRVAFTAEVVVDTSSESIFSKGAANSYQGGYCYEIDGKKIFGSINGTFTP